MALIATIDGFRKELNPSYVLCSVADAAAMIALLQERIELFGEISQPWEIAAFSNARSFLSKRPV